MKICTNIENAYGQFNSSLYKAGLSGALAYSLKKKKKESEYLGKEPEHRFFTMEMMTQF